MPSRESTCIPGRNTGQEMVRSHARTDVRPVGLDATCDMLRRAADGGLICPLVVSRAQELPFRAETFQMVSAVTSLDSGEHKNRIPCAR
jgi:ubiquinone/menaquinone biosynthesis C-methylase UbiE